jgi:hypothetical protein
MRRGKRTANIIWGNSASVLVGDFLFSRAFELMVEDGSLKVLKILSSASSVIAEGEVEQLTAQRQIETDEEQYLAIISAKTALFAAACRVAPVIAEVGEESELALDSYGKQPRHRLPADGRRHRLCVGCRGDGQGRRRRLPRRQDDPAADPRLCARKRGGPTFRTRDEAIAYAERHKIPYHLVPATPVKLKIQAYADNFR